MAPTRWIVILAALALLFLALFVGRWVHQRRRERTFLDAAGLGDVNMAPGHGRCSPRIWAMQWRETLQRKPALFHITASSARSAIENVPGIELTTQPPETLQAEMEALVQELLAASQA